MKQALACISDLGEYYVCILHRVQELACTAFGTYAHYIHTPLYTRRVVDERKLMDQSEVEQELACTENLTEAFNR